MAVSFCEQDSTVNYLKFKIIVNKERSELCFEVNNKPTRPNEYNKIDDDEKEVIISKLERCMEENKNEYFLKKPLKRLKEGANDSKNNKKIENEYFKIKNQKKSNELSQVQNLYIDILVGFLSKKLIVSDDAIFSALSFRFSPYFKGYADSRSVRRKLRNTQKKLKLKAEMKSFIQQMKVYY